MAKRNDLDRLAELHSRAFNRMRVLEQKVAAIQENSENYATSVGDWMCEVVASLQGIDHYNPVHPSFWRLVDKIADSIPHLKHEHIYEWHDGIGKCLCGHTIEHPRASTDDDLYRHSRGSTANRNRGY